MEEPPHPRTLAQYPYVTVRLACMHCPERVGRYRLARLVERYGADAPLDRVLFELSRGCRWQVPPGTKRRKYLAYCRAFYSDLMYRPPPDERPVLGKPRLRLVG